MCCYRANPRPAAMSSSVSFRITRTAEDLAQAITALSQRLIKLEERQEAIELRLRQQQQDSHRIPDQELATLDGIDQLLKETRELLQTTDVGTSDVGTDQNTPPLEMAPASLQLDFNQQDGKAVSLAPEAQPVSEVSSVDAEACAAEGDGAAGEDHREADHQTCTDEQSFTEEQQHNDDQRFSDEQPWQDGHHMEHQDDGGIAA